MINITTTIPVRVEITHYTPGTPGYYVGPPENCEPPEPPEIDFTVRTLSGSTLYEQDFDQESWKALTDDVFTAAEAERINARDDARIDAEIIRREWYADGY